MEVTLYVKILVLIPFVTLNVMKDFISHASALYSVLILDTILCVPLRAGLYVHTPAGITREASIHCHP